MPSTKAPLPRQPASSDSALPAGRATIADVARAAGVSKATVSRFFNHRETLLTPDIAARVQAAVTALAYSPSPMAQALSRGRSRLIGLVVADVTNPFSVAVLRGAEKACQEAGYLVMLFNLGNESGRERQAIEALASYQVEGFILNRVGDDAAAMAEAARKARPMVLVDRRNDTLAADFVSLDNVGATRMAAQHLLDAGFRHLLFVTEPVADVSSRVERAEAFLAFVQAAGISGDVLEHEHDDAGLSAGLRRLRAGAAGGRAAVISGNAVTTLRVSTVVAGMGWSWGLDLGFVGFDETDWAPLVGPGLTTVAQPTDALGHAAVACLLERLRGLGMRLGRFCCLGAWWFVGLRVVVPRGSGQGLVEWGRVCCGCC
ncbi:LacI family DNA-binding transcriptional regulator [Xylophilus rhododendri]|uniref:LacI family DNA-binding transcriptional regulator n=1 Tax=Xylophilus rhododendri TaxID=2697032 RepID=UPI00389A3C38